MSRIKGVAKRAKKEARHSKAINGRKSYDSQRSEESRKYKAFFISRTLLPADVSQRPKNTPDLLTKRESALCLAKKTHDEERAGHLNHRNDSGSHVQITVN